MSSEVAAAAPTFLNRGDADWLTSCTPGSGLFLEDPGDTAATGTADRRGIAYINIPIRKRVPVATNQCFTTLVAVGARSVEIVDIAGIDITQAVVHRNFPCSLQ